jgi:virulence-associated protein VagC
MLGTSYKDKLPIYSLLVRSRGGRWCIDVLNKPWDTVEKHARMMHKDQKYPREDIKIVETIHEALPDFIK